ncbi:MAG: carboxypeptidase-like regulatory domain-containing protein [bacterium]|nr:carboxypeptidase-like regulatory domain-containing protein [bacterium]
MMGHSRPSLRAACLAVVAAIATLAGIAADLAAQTARVPRPQRPAFLMLRDPVNQPIEGAIGLVLADPARSYPVLRRLCGTTTFFTREPDAIGAGPSRRTGTLQLGGDAPRPGAVLVLGDEADGGHLAGFVERLLPGQADKLQLGRAATLVAPTPDSQITVYAARSTPHGRAYLPALRGERVPLPPGTYDVWIECSGAFLWRKVRAQAEQEITFTAEDFAADGRELVRENGQTITPESRPDVVLVGEERERCRLIGRAGATTLAAHEPATGRIARDIEPRFEAAESLALEVRGPGGKTLGDTMAHGFVLSRDLSDNWRILGANRVVDGKLTLPRVNRGDDWLLVTSPIHPPLARPIAAAGAAADDQRPLVFAIGEDLRVRVRLANRDPAGDVLLEYVPRDHPVATIAVRSDRRGNVDFGRVTTPGTLRTSDPRFANVAIELTKIPSKGVRLELDPGFTVRGRIVLPDGKPAPHVTVTLTAQDDELRPARRNLVTGKDGTFAFGGLVEGNQYRLFATTRRLGRTWSSRFGRFLASAEPLVLTIKDEDPVLGPGR